MFVADAAVGMDSLISAMGTAFGTIKDDMFSVRFTTLICLSISAPSWCVKSANVSDWTKLDTEYIVTPQAARSRQIAPIKIASSTPKTA